MKKIILLIFFVVFAFSVNASFAKINSVSPNKNNLNRNSNLANFNSDAGDEYVEVATPKSKEECKKRGWKSFNDPTFKNQGDCIRWVNQNTCGLVADDEGNVYATVRIGDQCWMAENINIGTMLASVSDEPNTSDQVIEKWCYDDSAANCEQYGGLYSWDEVMRGSKEAGTQGICPSGWHVPTDAEYYTLAKTVLAIIDSPNEQLPCSLYETGNRCADVSYFFTPGGEFGVGRALKAVGSVGASDDLVGFKALLAGYRSNYDSYNGLNEDVWELNYGSFWTSTEESSTKAWSRSIGWSSPFFRGAGWESKTQGYSLRCLKD